VTGSPDLAFVVYGIPAPGGSKKAFIPRRKDGSLVTRPDGSPIVSIVDDSKRNKSWRGAVVEAVRQEIAPAGQLADGYPLEDVALELSVVFTVPKPKTVKRDRPIVKPDALKLLRSTEDALVDAGLLKDDALIWQYRRLAKVYPGTDPMALSSPGAVIYVFVSKPNAAIGPPAADQLPLGVGL
jgi:Holliday junction resolvase RusA-like endonuclease